jgi:hypothetical protein
MGESRFVRGGVDHTAQVDVGLHPDEIAIETVRHDQHLREERMRREEEEEEAEERERREGEGIEESEIGWKKKESKAGEEEEEKEER